MNRIKQLREERGMSQVRLSIELGVSQETVSAYENGKHFPSVQSLIKLSEIFRVAATIFLDYQNCRTMLYIILWMNRTENCILFLRLCHCQIKKK